MQWISYKAFNLGNRKKSTRGIVKFVRFKIWLKP